MKHYCSFLAVLLAVLAILSGCSYIKEVSVQYETPDKNAQSDILIGVAYPVNLMDTTTQYIRGVQLAVDEINDSGGINNRNLKILIEDDGASVTTGIAVAQSFVENPEIAAVIGHWNSRVSIAAAGIYEKAGVVMITPASTSPELTRKGYKYVFCQVPSDEKIGKLMAEFAAKQGYKKIVIYYADDEYGRSLANSFEDNGRNYGVKVVDRVAEFGGGQYFLSLIDKWNAFGYDAFFIADVMPNGGVFIKNLRENGIDSPVLGATGLDKADFIEMLGEKADGTVMPTLFNPASGSPKALLFVSKFKKQYGNEPDVWAVQGYETVKMLAYAIEKAKSAESYNIAAELHDIQNWEGITGVLSFRETGEIDGKKLAVKIIRNGRFEYRDE